jgi:hypothetical protein
VHPKGLVRLLTIGLVVMAFAVGGPWFWPGVGLAFLIVAGVGGGTRRPGAWWTGSFALVMTVLVHLKTLEPLVGMALAGIALIGFLLIWTQGPARAQRQPAPLAPYLLRRRAG